MGHPTDQHAPAVLAAWLVLQLLGALPPAIARAAAPEFSMPDLNSIVPAESARTLLKTFGVLMNYRAYAGASPRGIAGFDLGFEATLVHLPTGFMDALSGGSGGGASDGSALGALPSVKLQLSKGLGPAADLGIAGLAYKGTYIWGAGIKFTLFEPPEGPSWALRASYSETRLATSSLGLPGIPIPTDGVESGEAFLDVNTRTISAQLVASKGFSFAEPYIGIGADWVTGQLEVPITIAVLGESQKQTLVSDAYHAYQLQAFTGVAFRILPVGVRIAMEGSYSNAGMHTLGTVVGFAF
ncbi:MAG: hypothetical protein NDJ89_12425 [Oligoflexia bacterium]|nr:hypothetical protein [Oligoflexia bacterium]